MKTNFFSLAFLLLINIIYSQNIGDYRTIASGNWEDSTKWQTYDGIRFMPTFHPAYLLRNPPAKKEAWEDLQMVMTELAGVPKKGN